MKVTSKVYIHNLKLINTIQQKALVGAVDALELDVKDSQIMPFDTGTMQNRNMYVNDRQVKRGVVTLNVDTPYASRLYFHPEYNFQVINNPNAQALWFEPWITGNKKLFINIAFCKLLKKEFKKYATKGN